MNRQEKEFEARKNKILKSAEKLFLKHGFSEVTLNQIAIDADFGKSTLYHYFKSKNEILYVIIRKHDLKRLEKCKSAFNEAQTAYDKVYAYLKEYYDYVKNKYELFMLTYKNNYLLYREIIPNLSTNLIEKYEIFFQNSGESLKEQLRLGEKDGYFQNIKDKDFQLGYIMVTTRGLIFFLFQHLYITKSLSKNEVDSYFNLHLDLILKNV